MKQIRSEAIKEWPSDERPREKLLKNGEHSLSSTELLAILLRTGSRGQTAMELARKILTRFGSFRNMSHTDLRDWKEFKGLGGAKLAQIKSALEIARRIESEDRNPGIFIKDSSEAAKFFLPRMRDLKKEVFKLLLLDSKNRVIELVEVTEGTVNQAHPMIREIISKALQYFAPAMICAHNHPSGDPTPSNEDRQFTRVLLEAGNLMQVSLLDHLIIGNNCYYSFADQGDMGRG